MSAKNSKARMKQLNQAKKTKKTPPLGGTQRGKTRNPETVNQARQVGKNLAEKRDNMYRTIQKP